MRCFSSSISRFFPIIPLKRVLAAYSIVAVLLLMSWGPSASAQSGRVSQDGAPEFSARLVWKTGGQTSKAQLFVKKDRYRIEHLSGVRTDLGYAGVTIVRLDEQKVWYILSQRRMVISVPLTTEYVLPLAVTLEGEEKRTLIGEGQVDNRPALLYEVFVRNRLVGAERYYQWVDPKRDVLLKLMSQDRDWYIEYQHLVLSPQPDFFFEPPLGYQVIEAEEVNPMEGHG